MFFATMLLARWMGKTVFGEYGMILSTISMFTVFSYFGLGITATKYVSEYRNNDPERAGRIIAISEIFALFSGSFMTIGMLLCAPWISRYIINAPQLCPHLMNGAPVLFFGALCGSQLGALAGFEAFKTIAFINFITGLISFILLIILTWSFGLTGAIWGIVINQAMNWFFNHIALRRECIQKGIHCSFRNCMYEIYVLWNFSLPAALCSMIIGLANWICNAILANRPNGYSELGIYNAANQWYMLLLILPGILGQVLLPVCSERLASNYMLQLRIWFFRMMKLNATLVFPIVLGAAFISPNIMSWYGDSFKNGWPTLIIVLFASGIFAINGPGGIILSASGKMWVGFIINLGWAVTFILGTILLIRWGSAGLASAKAMAYIVQFIWTFLFAFKVVGTEPMVSKSQ